MSVKEYIQQNYGTKEFPEARTYQLSIKGLEQQTSCHICKHPIEDRGKNYIGQEEYNLVGMYRPSSLIGGYAGESHNFCLCLKCGREFATIHDMKIYGDENE